jgi:tetratricopeptide (TPR) repeat protein
VTPARRGALAATLGAVLLGCGPGTVTRIVDGQMLEGRPIPPEAYASYLKAELWVAAGNRKAALAELENALDADPRSPQILTRIGELTCLPPANPSAGHRAFSWFERALERDAEYAPAFLGRARCLEALGRKGEALRDAEQGAYLDPLLLESTRTVARLLFAVGRHADAWRWLDARVTLEPESRDAWQLVLEAATREKDAVRSLRARRALGLAKEQDETPVDEALDEALATLRADPEDTEAWTRALVAADLRGDERKFHEALTLLSPEALAPSERSLALLAELIARRVGPDGRAALEKAR